MAGSHWDREEALSDGGMLYFHEGHEGEFRLNLPGETVVLGLHNIGAWSVTVTVTVEVGGEPQYICLCFLIPMLLIIMAAVWISLKGGSLDDEQDPGGETGHPPHPGYGPYGGEGRGPPTGEGINHYHAPLGPPPTRPRSSRPAQASAPLPPPEMHAVY